MKEESGRRWRTVEVEWTRDSGDKVEERGVQQVASAVKERSSTTSLVSQADSHLERNDDKRA